MALLSAPEKSIEREDAVRYKYIMGAGGLFFIMRVLCEQIVSGLLILAGRDIRDIIEDRNRAQKKPYVSAGDAGDSLCPSGKR